MIPALQAAANQEVVMKKLSLCITVLFWFWIFILPACSGQIRAINVDADGVALKGYDPVAYFTMGRPVKGQKEFQHLWQGAKWFFATREHLAMFQENPAKYAPQYGGYCAYAVSRGVTADIDPAAWSIVADKLYLNLNKEVQKTWNMNREGYIQKADRNWPQLLSK